MNALLLVLAGLIGYSYLTQASGAYQYFEFNPVKLQLGKLGIFSTQIIYIFQIKNPTATSATVQRVWGNILANGGIVGTFLVDKSFTIPPGGAVNVAAQVSISNSGFISSIVSILKTGKTPAVVFKGNLQAAIIGAIPFEYSALISRDLGLKKIKTESVNGIGKVRQINCAHSICGKCHKPLSHKIGSLVLNDVCSDKCQNAKGPVCQCKCEGEFHQGANAKKLQFILNPKLAKKAKERAEQTTRQRLGNFHPETILDYVALFLYGARINTKNFDRFSDPTFRRDAKNLALTWLTKTGGLGLDQLAKSFNESHNFGLDEMQTTQMMADFVAENPGGVGPYIKKRESEQAGGLQPFHTYDYSTQAPQPHSNQELTPFDSDWINGRRVQR